MLEPGILSRLHQLSFGRRDHGLRKFGRNGSPLLNHSVAKEHGDDVLVVIKQTIAVDLED